MTSRVWRSQLPLFLKQGVAGAAEAMANPDGTYRSPLTVRRLMAHRYYDGQPLSERTIRYQLRALEALGVLVGPSASEAGAGLGRGHTRTYRFNADALAHLDLTVPALSPPHRRKGATEKGQQKGATGVQTAREKGATKGATKRGNSPIDPFCTDLQRTQAAARCAATPQRDENTTPETALHLEAKVDATEHPTADPHLCANDQTDSDDGSGRGLRQPPRSDQAPAPGARIQLPERTDPPRPERAEPGRPSVGPHHQQTLGPLDITPSAKPTPQWGEILEALRHGLRPRADRQEKTG